jgi:hypothetical protein
MTSVGWLEIALFAAMIGLLARPLGGYLARVYGDNGTLLQPLLGPIEDTLYRLAGIKPEIEHSWFGTQSPCWSSMPLASSRSTPFCGFRARFRSILLG